eukprot:8497079-Alexandrium_andersonii.AAC.1
MGFLPARAKHSEIGRTPHMCQDSMNRISSARAAETSSESRNAPCDVTIRPPARFRSAVVRTRRHRRR